MFKIRSVSAFALLLVFLSAPGTARADNPNVNLDDFWPSPHAKDILHLMTNRIGDPMDLSAGLWLTYRKDALSLEGSGNAGEVALVSDQLVGDLYAALPLFGIASIGIDIPVFFMNSGETPSGAGFGNLAAADGAALGDVRLSAKIRLLGKQDRGFGIGLAEDVTFPTATGDNYNGEDFLTSRTTLILDYAWEGFLFGVNVGYFLRPDSSAFNPPMEDELILSAGAELPIICDKFNILLASNTRTAAADPFAEGKVGTMLLGGFRTYVSHFVVGLAGGGSLGTLPGTPAWEVMLNIGWDSRPTGCDLDGDGIRNSADRCKSQYGPLESDGCPDRDKDGVLDMDDLCPDVKGTKELQGCPDKDGDGITDAEDRCPDVKGPKALKGCPDKDGDGVPDIDDGCPDVKGLAKFNGCPDTDNDGIEDEVDDCPTKPGPEKFGGCPDTDKDGIPDPKDKCPDVPGKAQYDGCPPPAPKTVQVTKEKIVILDKVFFATNSAKIMPKSYPLLKDVAKVLVENDWIKKVQVEGHTDDVGNAKTNMTLSQKRAESVVEFLVKEGVAKERLIALGFGPNKPLINEKTADARAQNRRVEFTIIEQ